LLDVNPDASIGLPVGKELATVANRVLLATLTETAVDATVALVLEEVVNSTSSLFHHHSNGGPSTVCLIMFAAVSAGSRLFPITGLRLNINFFAHSIVPPIVLVEIATLFLFGQFETDQCEPNVWSPIYGPYTCENRNVAKTHDRVLEMPDVAEEFEMSCVGHDAVSVIARPQTVFGFFRFSLWVDLNRHAPVVCHYCDIV
jgi:hypothetical protein